MTFLLFTLIVRITQNHIIEKDENDAIIVIVWNALKKRTLLFEP